MLASHKKIKENIYTKLISLTQHKFASDFIDTLTIQIHPM